MLPKRLAGNRPREDQIMYFKKKIFGRYSRVHVDNLKKKLVSSTYKCHILKLFANKFVHRILKMKITMIKHVKSCLVAYVDAPTFLKERGMKFFEFCAIVL